MQIGIIITDIHLRKSFDVYNLVKRGFPNFKVILCDNARNVFFHFAYNCNKINVLRCDSYSTFEGDLKRLVSEYCDYKLIYLPIEEITTEYFIKYRQNNITNIISLLPDSTRFDLVRNKHKLNDFCREHGIDSPMLYNSINEIKIIEYPLIVKPRYGAGSKGIERFENGERVIDYLDASDLRLSDFVIQELLPNGKHVQGAFFLCKDGQVVSYYTHQRIRTVPAEGGVTVLSKFDTNFKIKETGEKLINLTKWNGLLMVEFIYDSRDGKYKIIEVNPRIWGSILLSEFSGVNLLKNYILLCLDVDFEVEPINYNSKIRWFFPMDIIGYIKSGFKIEKFWDFNKDTCYINFSYSSFYRTFLFLIASFLNFKNFRKIFR